MKYLVFLIVLFPLMLDAQISESQRSKNVIKEQYPLLEKAFLAEGLTFGSSVFIRIFKDEDVLEIWIKKGANTFCSSHTKFVFFLEVWVPK